jgi:hypothetical protein
VAEANENSRLFLNKMILKKNVHGWICVDKAED